MRLLLLSVLSSRAPRPMWFLLQFVSFWKFIPQNELYSYNVPDHCSLNLFQWYWYTAMGNDKRGCNRGACTLCECIEYEVNDAQGLLCKYCGHPPMKQVLVVHSDNCLGDRDDVTQCDSNTSRPPHQGHITYPENDKFDDNKVDQMGSSGEDPSLGDDMDDQSSEFCEDLVYV